jgi:hypothetical protein
MHLIPAAGPTIGLGGQASWLTAVAEADQVITQASPWRPNRQRQRPRHPFRGFGRWEVAGLVLRPRPRHDRFLRRLGFFDTGNPKRYAYR